MTLSSLPSACISMTSIWSARRLGHGTCRSRPCRSAARPQGTLFGKNSIGGSIRLISKKPEGSNTGYIEGVYGTRNRIDAKGAFDASLIDDVLYMRANFMMKDQKGYIKRLDFTCQMKANVCCNSRVVGGGSDEPSLDSPASCGVPLAFIWQVKSRRLM